MPWPGVVPGRDVFGRDVFGCGLPSDFEATVGGEADVEMCAPLIVGSWVVGSSMAAAGSLCASTRRSRPPTPP